ncbi:hypothetical protein BGX21_004856 [Mortierella sp. AD011]|nr:hypothetical protein BGX21_004856 [Mortierella sp. AD011]
MEEDEGAQQCPIFAEFVGLKRLPSNRYSILANAQEASVMCTGIEWLEHSNKRYCELCKHNFEFTPIYSPEMPESIPKWILIREGVEALGAGVKLVLRAILVITIWLVILPYFTIWIWRLYFWVGDWFAFSANGLPVPTGEISNSTISGNNTQTLRADMKPLEQMDTFTRLVHQTIPPEYKWLSNLLLDCFDGQIISAVVVVVFVAIFLLREWVIQNQDPEEGDILVDIPARPADAMEFDQADIDGAVGRLLGAEQLLQQQLGARARAEEPHNRDIAQPGHPALAPFPQQNPTNHQNQSDIWASDSYNFPVDSDSQHQPPSSSEFPRYSPQGNFPTSGESSSARAGFVYDPLSETFHPDSPWMQGSSSSNYSSAAGSHSTTSRDLPVSDNGEGSSTGWKTKDPFGDKYIRDRNNHPLMWKEDIPLTYDNVFRKPDGSVMTLNEKIACYEELRQSRGLSSKDGIKLLQWRAEQFESPHMGITMEEKIQNVGRLDRMKATSMADGDVPTTQHTGAPLPALAPALAPVPIPVPAPAPAPAPVPAPAPAPRIAVAPVPPVAAPAELNDDLDDMNVEELDGMLDVIGMRGSYWLLLQNSLLMSALICASLGLGVWVPYMIGKTVVLLNPLNILRLPLRVLNKITDPITDFLLDRIIPMMSSLIYKIISSISSRISPYVSPIIGPYLGGKALKPLGYVIQDHIAPIWRAVVQEVTAVTPTKVQETTQEIAMEAPSHVNVSISTGGTTYQQIMTKWNDIVYGGSSNDKVAAITIGYAIIFALAWWYMNRTRHSYGHTVSRIVRSVIRQQGLILKIAFFMTAEMILFPTFCGIIVALTTLPALPGATLASRWAFYLQSPNWFITMHWLVGTAIMFNIAGFVSLCRSVVRPGVMWFVRDPNDEAFHPVREILERPVLVQFRRFGIGMLMYFTLIIFGISLTTHCINLCLRGVFPLRWPVDEPISDLPIDLLLFHLVVPLTVNWLNPLNRFRALFVSWWRLLARIMRLSSFMYGKDGQRYPEEEGHIVYRTWKAWFLRYRPPIPGLDGQEGDANVVGSGEELDIDAPVVFVRDGGLFRVPNTDRAVHLKNRRILVPVDSEGRALDPKEDLPGEIDPLMEFQPRGRAPRLPIDPREGTVIVYTPPNFKSRLISFIILIWTTTLIFLSLSVVVPLILGRSMFAIVTERQVHDVYSFAVGAYTIGITWHFQHWLFSVSPQGLPSVNIHTHLKKALDFGKRAIKLVYFVFFFGVIFPFVLGLMVELFVIIPLRTAVNDNPGIVPVFCWAVGLVYMKSIHRAANQFPNLTFTRDMNRVIARTDPLNWDIGFATLRFIIPYLSLSAAAVASPTAMAWVVAEGLNLEGPTRSRFFRLSYPAALLIFVITVGFKEGVVVLRKWSQYVRDREYLVGQHLHNHDEVEENAGEQQVPEQEQGPNANDEIQVNNEVPEYKDVESDDGDIPDLEPARAPLKGSSSFGINDHDYGGGSSNSLDRKDHEYRNNYGMGSSSFEDVYSISNNDFEEDGADEEEEDEAIAGRLRYRRSRRLQAIRGSLDDR